MATVTVRDYKIVLYIKNNTTFITYKCIITQQSITISIMYVVWVDWSTFIVQIMIIICTIYCNINNENI